MFMSFGPSPRILRLFCRASIIEWDHPEFPIWVRRVAKDKRQVFDGARAVVVCDIWQVQTSCGYGVPRVKKGLYAADDEDARDGSHKASKSMDEVLREGSKDAVLTELAVFEQRPTLDRDAGTMVQKNKMHQYQMDKNCHSMDGLPGLRAARREAGQILWLGDAKAKVWRIAAEKEAMAVGFGLAIFLYIVFIGVSKNFL